MKKIISFLICFAVICTSCAIAVNAETRTDPSEYPVILVPGYSSSQLYNADTNEHVWGLDMNGIVSMVLENIALVGRSLGAMTVGNSDLIAKTVGEAIIELVGQLECNPDGTSKYNIKEYYSDAEDSNITALEADHPEGEFRAESYICNKIAKVVGKDNVFQFSCDFRMGSEFCATELRDYVASVKEYTGSDKVNIIAVSHGGQTTSTYLTLYGQYTDDIANAVLTVPAIGGAGFAYDPLNEIVDLDEECILRFVEHGNLIEEDFDWLLKANQLGFLDEICEKIDRYAMQVIGYWGSMWDFVPTDKYEEIKAKRLNENDNARLIEISDRYHYEILPKVADALNACREKGMNISIIAGTGNSIVTGLHVNSDGIIPTDCSTGATCAPLGSRFSDGYTQINECGGKYKVSPAMDIDASTCFLPDNTWFVEGLFHGMTFLDDYARDLSLKLLLTDDISDVYSDPEYPQFHGTTNVSSSVYFEFKGCTPGYIDSNATSLYIKNICEKSNITVTGIVADNYDFGFRLSPFKTLKPGESIEVPFIHSVPQVSKKAVYITVCYTTNTITPAGYRTEGFTIMNGEDADAGEGFIQNTSVTPFDSLISGRLSSFLSKLGLKEFFAMIYSVLYYWFSAVGQLIKG